MVFAGVIGKFIVDRDRVARRTAGVELQVSRFVPNFPKEVNLFAAKEHPEDASDL